VSIVELDFEYQEVVRAREGKKVKVVGFIYKCRSGYFYRSKSGAFRSNLFKSIAQVKAKLKSGDISL